MRPWPLQDPSAPVPAPRPPLDEWWPDGVELGLPLTWRTKLSMAKDYSEEQQWSKALGLLNEMYQKEIRDRSKLGTHHLREQFSPR